MQSHKQLYFVLGSSFHLHSYSYYLFTVRILPELRGIIKTLRSFNLRNNKYYYIVLFNKKNINDKKTITLDALAFLLIAE